MGSNTAARTVEILNGADDELPRGAAPNGLGVTFRDSKKLPIHGWYPYVEGFSAHYIEGLVREFGEDGIVYDPFGGSGTVNLISSLMGVPNAFSEANPFMRFVAETKVNARFYAQANIDALAQTLRRFTDWSHSPAFEKAARSQSLDGYREGFNGRDFFADQDIRELLALKEAALEIGSDVPAFRDLLLLAIAAVTVACSHMTRRADLRRRRPDEYVGRVVDVRAAVLQKLAVFERDIRIAPARHAPVQFVSADCRTNVEALHGSVSLVLTSPPYLNGTSYIRNTKLELWLLGFILSEKELVEINKVCMVCGINNVIKNRPPQYQFENVEVVARELDLVSPDLRIPALVRGYFSDMLTMFRNCADYLKPQGRLVLDIGDSRFYGVHVPTDALLIKVAAEAGLELSGERLLARRHSRDKSPLTQTELTFVHAR